MTQLKKTLLRNELRHIRQKISVTEKNKFAEFAAKHLINSEIFQQAQNIACYLSLAEEFNTKPIIKNILLSQKKCFLPILSGENLIFARYQNKDTVKHNKFNILEPKNCEEKISPEQLDLILLPLVGFDLFGHRLGMGGGYYDRTFNIVQKNSIKKNIFIGIGFSDQQVEILPHDSWDILLDGVLTEEKLTLFNNVK